MRKCDKTTAVKTLSILEGMQTEPGSEYGTESGTGSVGGALIQIPGRTSSAAATIYNAKGNVKYSAGCRVDWGTPLPVDPRTPGILKIPPKIIQC